LSTMGDEARRQGPRRQAARGRGLSDRGFEGSSSPRGAATAARLSAAVFAARLAKIPASSKRGKIIHDEMAPISAVALHSGRIRPDGPGRRNPLAPPPLTRPKCHEDNTKEGFARRGASRLPAHQNIGFQATVALFEGGNGRMVCAASMAKSSSIGLEADWGLIAALGPRHSSLWRQMAASSDPYAEFPRNREVTR